MNPIGEIFVIHAKVFTMQDENSISFYFGRNEAAVYAPPANPRETTR